MDPRTVNQPPADQTSPGPGRSETASAGSPPKLANVPKELADNPQYEVVRELGRGGMGVVYLARNRLMDRLEVLKVVNKELLDRPGAVERFLREIRSAAQLNHPNVVTAYAALQMGELLVLAMEYVDGEDLAAVVKARGPLPVANACYYAYQAALGLQNAFEKGMVHRDVKPQNLILSQKGRRHVVKVLDFGLAKATSEGKERNDITAPNRMLGTPDYIAPEQLSDAARADVRADLYSLGCTLYYLLTGAPPFEGDNLYGILHGHMSKEAPSLSTVRAEVPAGLAAVVARMMAKDPAARPQTPAEVARELLPFVKPGANGPPAPGGRTMAPVARKAAKAARETMIGGAGWPSTTTEAPSPARTKSAGGSGPDRRASRKPATRRRWLLAGGAVAAAVVLAGLLLAAVTIFKVKTKDGLLVVEVNEPNAEVYVDGEKATVTWDGGGKRAEVRVRPGTRKVEVKKDGFAAYGEEVALEDGGRRVLTARLDKVPPPIPDKVSPLADPDRAAAEWALSIGGGVKIARGENQFTDVGKLADLPKDAFQLRRVDLWGNQKVSDADLARLKGLRHLEELCLTGVPVGDEGMRSLEGSTSLKQLILHTTRVTDAGLLRLKGLTALEELALDGLPVTDSSLDVLVGMKKLRHLFLPGTRITSKGLERLKELPELRTLHASIQDADLEQLSRIKTLEELYLQGNPVTDAGLKPIGRMSHLRTLDLSATKVTGSGLADLKGLAEVERLHLSKLPLTDEHLAPLKELKKLRELDLKETRVTAAGVKALKDALPQCDVQLSVPVTPVPAKPLSDEDVRARIATLEKQLAALPSHAFDFGLHNELRHLYGAGDRKSYDLHKSLYHADVILGHLPMDGYMLICLGTGFSVTSENKPEVIESLLENAQRYPEYRFVAAACWLRSAELMDDGAKTRELLRQVMDLKGDNLDPYRTRAATRLAALERVAPAPPARGDKDWKPLFNGKNLTGWMLPDKPSGEITEVAGLSEDGGATVVAFFGRQKNDGKRVPLWWVKDGLLIGSGPTSHLFSKRGYYTNFRYRVEAMINDKGNSGQYFRTEFGPGFPKGYEAQINATHSDPIRTGSLYPADRWLKVSAEDRLRILVLNHAPHKPDEWFTQEVIAEGNHIIIKVNGKTTADWKDPNSTSLKGHFALQCHDPGTVVKFRKVEVQELPASKKD